MARTPLIILVGFGACVGILFVMGGPRTPQPPFHIKKANREIGHSWRLNPVIDGHGRWLVHDEELNLLFLAIDDELHGSLTICGSREKLTLGTRQGKTRAFSNPTNTLFVGLPDGSIHEFPLSEGFAARVFALATDERGRASDVVELLCDRYDDAEKRKLQALLEDHRSASSKPGASQPTKEP